jgi:hypothetical protein
MRSRSPVRVQAPWQDKAPAILGWDVHMVKEASEEAVGVATLVGYINIAPLGLYTVTGDTDRLKSSCLTVRAPSHLAFYCPPD